MLNKIKKSFVFIIFLILSHGIIYANCSHDIDNTPLNQNTDNQINKTNKNDLPFIFRNDSSKHETTIYLYVANNAADSLVIKESDCSFDSIVQINDSLWTYFYKEYRHNESYIFSINQLLLGQRNDSIHVYFAFYYQYYNELTNKEIIKHDTLGGTWFHMYTLDLVDTSSKAHLSLIRYNERFMVNREKCEIEEFNTSLNYDDKDHIYYNYIHELNGEYAYMPLNAYYADESGVKTIYFDNQEVKAIKIWNKLIIYFKGSWFHLTDINYTTISPFLGL